MKFTELKYERPDYDAVVKEYETLLNELENAKDKASFLPVFERINALRSSLSTMYNLAYTRHSINTADEFYDKENEFWDETNPLFSVYDTKLSRLCVECPFREELYSDIPEPYFLAAECQLKSFREDIVPLLQKENKLVSEYGKLKASAKITFNGETYNLATISSKAEDTDPAVRKGAMDAKLSFYEAHEADFDRIYDELVKVRTQIAHTLGYPSFTELGYQRMMRLDYNRAMVDTYRKEILREIVPAATELYAKQAKRLGTPTVAYYDKAMEFPSGNPMPKGTYEELIQAAGKMYHEMSPETGEFIDRMIEDELWDLKSRDGKQMGGYCTGIPDYKVPFIFANFNGTSGDVNVLTHEAGHAFQYYMSRNIPVLDLQWPTNESAEITSMSMEFNAWPWLELFFKEDTEKYRYLHLSGALKFLPYGILVDHFQHEIYDHPEWTPDERKACWRNLEKMYEPYKDYTGAPILEKGCWWFQQGHIFESPFYYVDYTLAQVCALQFWAKERRHDPNAWKDYLALCQLGGTKTFTGLVEAAGLKVPFEEGCLSDVVREVHSYLSEVDDTAL